jgi:hypothetical protein
MGCKTALTLKTGWTFVDGKHVNVGIHPGRAELAIMASGIKEAALQAQDA